MSTILACTDGSIYAPSVYGHSAWAALRCASAVRVLYVLARERSRTIDLTGAIGFDASAELTEELVSFEEARARVARLKSKALLDDARRELLAAGIDDVQTVARHGTLVETIQEMEADVDLVVIGKRGEHADFAKGHLGGQLERVIRSISKPVLVASRSFKPVGSFLIAYDGGPSSLKAVEFARTMPLLRGLRCHILQAGHIDDKARWYVEETAGHLRTAGFEVHATTQPGHPEEVIDGYVKEKGIDLLVMGAYGHSPIRHLILGSTTTSMVRTCQVPVLMFR